MNTKNLSTQQIRDRLLDLGSAMQSEDLSNKQHNEYFLEAELLKQELQGRTFSNTHPSFYRY